MIRFDIDWLGCESMKLMFDQDPSQKANGEKGTGEAGDSTLQNDSYRIRRIDHRSFAQTHVYLHIQSPSMHPELCMKYIWVLL